MVSESGKKKRFVFSVRTLLVCVVVAAVPLGLYARWASAAIGQASAVKLLKKAGLSSISYDPPGAKQSVIYNSWLQYSTNPNRIDYFYPVKWISGSVEDSVADPGTVSEAFSKFSKLESLHLSSYRNLDVAKLSCTNTLRELSFAPSAVSNELILRLANFKQLSWLQLHASDKQSAASLNWEPIASLERIHFLNINNTYVGNDGAEALSKLQLLFDLTLYNCEIGEKGAASIAGLQKLQSLRLGSNKIGSEGARALGSLLEIKDLTVSGNQISSTGLEGWSKLTKLERLDVTGNSIDDNGLSALSQLPQLKQLHLIGNPIQGIGFAGFPKLELLWIDGGNLSKEGWHSLARLEGLKELRVVSGNDYPVHLLEGGFPELVTLMLNHGAMDESSWKSLHSYKKLTELQCPDPEPLIPLVEKHGCPPSLKKIQVYGGWSKEAQVSKLRELAKIQVTY